MRLIVIAAFVLTLTAEVFGQHLDFDKVISSDSSIEEKRSLVLDLMRRSFSPKTQIPKLTTKQNIKMYFDLDLVGAFAGKLPFDLALNDSLYYIRILPKSPGPSILVYFSSEQQVEKSQLIELLSTDSKKDTKFIVKAISFPDLELDGR